MPVLGRTADLASEGHAHGLDARNPLAALRDRFNIQLDMPYRAGTLPILWGFWDQGDLSRERKPSTVASVYQVMIEPALQAGGFLESTGFSRYARQELNRWRERASGRLLRTEVEHV